MDKMQIAALRKCDAVSFHKLKTGASHICASKRNPATEFDPFAQEIRVDIPCESILTDYESPRIDKREWTGFEYAGAVSYMPEWQTIASLLREGDTVTLEWQRGAWNSESLGNSGFVGDRLMFRINRGDKRLTFQIGHYTGPRDSCRMVRLA